jgi:hypothetical protein
MLCTRHHPKERTHIIPLVLGLLLLARLLLVKQLVITQLI